jgi:hypothetical protein
MADKNEPSGAQKAFGDVAPAFVGYTDDVLGLAKENGLARYCRPSSARSAISISPDKEMWLSLAVCGVAKARLC